MRIKLTILALAGLLTFSNDHAWSQATAVGVFDGQADIGKVLFPGAGTYSPARQDYTLTGSAM
jgi:hypothetical protein